VVSKRPYFEGTESILALRHLRKGNLPKRGGRSTDIVGRLNQNSWQGESSKSTKKRKDGERSGPIKNKVESRNTEGKRVKSSTTTLKEGILGKKLRVKNCVKKGKDFARLVTPKRKGGHGNRKG